MLFPYDDAVGKVLQSLTHAGLPLVLINTPPPNWTGGDRGFAAIPGGEDRFRRDFKRALRYAERLKPRISTSWRAMPKGHWRARPLCATWPGPPPRCPGKA